VGENLWQREGTEEETVQGDKGPGGTTTSTTTPAVWRWNRRPGGNTHLTTTVAFIIVVIFTVTVLALVYTEEKNRK
jgi:hypothetical protein